VCRYTRGSGEWLRQGSGTRAPATGWMRTTSPDPRVYLHTISTF